MAHNKLYRNFIILQEDERGYSNSSDKTLSGYAKVEAKGDKCKVSFYAQNLRQEDNYSMVLICCKRDLKQLIDLGPLAINEVGKGDTSKEYYVNNIAGLGISYEKISGAAICRIKNNEPEFIMHGFMNGEESADNWRKFKFIKADSKKYINKLDSEPKKREVISSDATSKAAIAQTNEVESNAVKPTQLQDEPAERKNEEVINTLDEDRHKNKENKKYDKCDEDYEKYEKHEKHDKCDEHEKHDKCDKCDKKEKYEKYYQCDECDKLGKYDSLEKNEDIEAVINKLAKKLDPCENIIDLKINQISEDIEVYGFIKYKKDYNFTWKKFKLEKKHRDENDNFNYIQTNSKRIEENFKLDRMDLIDFDGYEKDIQQGNLSNTGKGNVGQSGTGTTGQVGMGTAGQTNTGMEKITPISTGTMGQTGMEKITPISTGTTSQTGIGSTSPMTTGITGPTGGTMTPCNCNQLDLGGGQQPSISNQQQPATNQGFNINGEITLYFEKLAEGFQPYSGSLADINHCKWYKINVNSIEDLSDDSNYNQYTLAYYPMLNYYPYISKTGHYLLGYKCNRNGDIQYIVYAIPGSKDKNDQPYGGRTGFVTWTNDSSNGRGYWLMFYDFKNSSIVIPTK
ncbi:MULTISPECIES: hypothetical protein [unclassified Clostridium]|uniref:DUF7922 domain-containing protein n=1 Tax=unclassified Clostridium TaxID=2614128 RepID=UPI0002973253|nr:MULTISPECIES: hypothetical protein [unclassified Clostridium]EKQ56015.1 MAG: hypothetical protein A370_02417 [Clostridium sp. Maddingley MBC34-26]